MLFKRLYPVNDSRGLMVFHCRCFSAGWIYGVVLCEELIAKRVKMMNIVFSFFLKGFLSLGALTSVSLFLASSLMNSGDLISDLHFVLYSMFVNFEYKYIE
jgi:hypothetical protein